MRIILSRKAFDSTSGGVPNPLLPGGRLIPLPIPDDRSPIRYSDLSPRGSEHGAEVPIADLVTDLTAGRIAPEHHAHLDPDLNSASLPRDPGWRPLFGQEGAAQSHLARHGVGRGDLFLFFGLFRPVTRIEDRWVYVKGSRSTHIIWGWMQVARVWTVDDHDLQATPWARRHPHFHRGPDTSNVVYVAAARMSLPRGGVREGDRNSRPDERGAHAPAGAGVFARDRPELHLSAADTARPSSWDLPGWFHPGQGRPALTYHGRPDRWSRDGHRTRLQTVGRGQEFILDADAYPEATGWAIDLVMGA